MSLVELKLKNIENYNFQRQKWAKSVSQLHIFTIIKGQGLVKLMVESNLHALDINLITAMSEENEEISSV